MTLSFGNENHMIVFVVVLYITVLDKTVTKVLMGRKPPPPPSALKNSQRPIIEFSFWQLQIGS